MRQPKPLWTTQDFRRAYCHIRAMAKGLGAVGAAVSIREKMSVEAHIRSTSEDFAISVSQKRWGLLGRVVLLTRHRREAQLTTSFGAKSCPARRCECATLPVRRVTSPTAAGAYNSDLFRHWQRSIEVLPRSVPTFNWRHEVTTQAIIGNGRECEAHQRPAAGPPRPRSAGDARGNSSQFRHSLFCLSELRETNEWMLAKIIETGRSSAVVATKCHRASQSTGTRRASRGKSRSQVCG